MKIETLFWDIGGVVLTNGWDRSSRQKAIREFNLEGQEFEERHQQNIEAFDSGEISLKQYLERTVFYTPRPFTPNDFEAFMFAQSEAHQDTLALAQQLARSGKYFMAAMNNESLDLNLFRIERFRLRELFMVFFSSCYLGVRKPDERIYRRVLQITQRLPSECLFIDDRLENLEPARQAGMQVIHYQDAVQLNRQLEEFGVSR